MDNADEDLMDDRALEAARRFRYALLAPTAGGESSPWLGSRTLGVEVTVPELAERCGLGNLDPQHTGGDASQAAIEAALDVRIPDEGACLVTIRPDADALGAMAVLAARSDNLHLGAEALERIALVARADRFDRGPWPGIRPLPQGLADLEADTTGDAPLIAIRGACFDDGLTMERRVAMMLAWLLNGIEPSKYREQWRTRQRQLMDALSHGEIRLETRCAGSVAVLEASRTDALGLAYRLAPVVVAHDPEFRWRGTGAPHVRYAIAQWESGWIDLAAARRDIAEMESGWGGSPTIIGSPQGKGSELTLSDVLAVVARHLLGGPDR